MSVEAGSGNGRRSSSPGTAGTQSGTPDVPGSGTTSVASSAGQGGGGGGGSNSNQQININTNVDGGGGGGSHRSSPTNSVGSTSNGASRRVTASRRGRGMRGGGVRSASPPPMTDSMAAMASPIATSTSLQASSAASPRSAASSAQATSAAADSKRHPSPPAQIVLGEGKDGGGKDAAGDDAGDAPTSSTSGGGGSGGPTSNAEAADNNGRTSTTTPRNSPPVISIGGAHASPPPRNGSADPHEENTPRHDHLSRPGHPHRMQHGASPAAARSERHHPNHPHQRPPPPPQERPPSPIRGPSSAAAAAAAAAKALRSGHRLMRPPGGGRAYYIDGRGGALPPDNAPPPPPPPPPGRGYHNIPYSPEDSAAAAYYASRHGRGGGDGHGGGYYDAHDMVGRRGGEGVETTNWPDEEQEGPDDGADPEAVRVASAVAAYRYEQRDREYLHHQQQHHHGYYEHPGGGYRPHHPALPSEYAPHNATIGGPPPTSGGEEEVDYDRNGRGSRGGFLGGYSGWRERAGEPERAEVSTGGAERSPESDGGRRYASPPSEREHRAGGSPTATAAITNNNKGKVVIGGPSPIHVARGMSTTPNANTTSIAANGRHITPHHNHNTRHSSRQQQQQKQQSKHRKSNSSTSSIFRGRPGQSSTGGAAGDYDDDDEDSPQRILLSLSKDTSFEDKGVMASGDGGKVQVVGGDDSVGAPTKGKKPAQKKATKKAAKAGGSKKGKAAASSSATEKKGSKKKKKSTKKSGKKAKDDACPPSPEGPPRIHHSHNQKRNNEPLYFDPMKSPNGKTNMLELHGPMIDSAPSFALFNTSFDSLGDPSKLAMTMSGGLGITPSFSFGMGVPSIKSRDVGPFPDAGPYPEPNNSLAGPYPDPNNSLRLSGSGSIGGFDPSISFGEYRPTVQAAKTMVVGGDHNSNPFGSDGKRSATIVLGGTSSSDGSPVRSLGRARSTSSGASPAVRKVGSGSGCTSVQDFYDILRSHKLAFEDCIFLLPGLKEALAENSEKEDKPKTDGAKSPPAAASSPPRSGSPKAKSPQSGTSSPDRGAGGDVDCPKSPLTGTSTPARSQGSTQSDKSKPSDAVIARRRVKSAICAFGGSGYATEQAKEESMEFLGELDHEDRDEVKAEDEAKAKTKAEADAPKSGDSKSIFRVKKEEKQDNMQSDEKADKDDLSKGVEDTRSEARKLYDEKLPDRFYENDDRLSWEIEDDPPIDVPEVSRSRHVYPFSIGSSDSNKRSYPHGSGIYHSDRDRKKMRPTLKADGVGVGVMMMPHHDSMAKARAALSGSPQPKMRYRCKLCGQPKQNHNCPYQQSLQRSIGTMVFKAVNAYTAAEPGFAAPPLSAMNNFVSSTGGDKSEASSAATTPSRGGPKTDTMLPKSADNKSAHITPESLRTGLNSPGGSSLSTTESPPRGSGGRTPVRSGGASKSKKMSRSSSSRRSSSGTPTHRSRGSASRRGRFPSIGSASSGGSEIRFVEPMELRPEQFRIVSPLLNRGSPNDPPYQYAALPLPYEQRKTLSDKLFGMSKEVPNLTDECASVLREARQRDMWDRAVADLLAQVVVVLGCPPEDHRLEGLRRHLLTKHGIAC